MRRLATVALLSLSCLALPVRAGLFDDDEARKRIEQLRTEVTELNQRAETASRNQLDFANQAEALRADVAKLRGDIEVLRYDLDAAQKRQKDFYIDLDTRLRKFEQPAVEAKPAAAPATEAADPATETARYEAALSQLKAGKFKEAGVGFLAFIKTWPESTLLPSAYYWGAYAHAQARQHAKAADLFAHFAATWPADERAPNALEAEIASLEALKDSKRVRATLQLLAEKYPASDAGKHARARLKKK
ncbi:MAG: tol-pal system protein YbgF [Rhodocyclales bacterium]|nr:tol-pal system protein YbgF [Rhodocyclales bacterium]